jgi:NADH dehydrogenase [ubiquinone] 1 alpha subcomplex assembly factor 1
METLMFNVLMLASATLFTSPALDSLQQRSDAARTLNQAIGQADGDLGHSFWTSSARATIEALGPGNFSATLEQSITDANWHALTNPALASKVLEQELRVALVDLEFKPLREAQLPLDFPEPTPVREIELKRYPTYRMVNTDVKGRGSNRAFWTLFSHIKENEIAMTAPVEMTYSQEGGNWEESKMSFLYGSPDMGEVGLAGRAEVLDAESGLFLSIGCRGRTNRASLEAARAQLMAWIDNQEELELAGNLRSMGYNSPMVRSSRQYFEVQIPVARRETPTPASIVLDFGELDAVQRWSPVNDSVMGGRSSSSITPSGEGSCVFQGRLSLENNGGFASVRTRPAELGLEGASALRLSFRGDGKTYKIRLRTNDRFNSVNYEVSFRTVKGIWEERSFPIESFVPVWRGRRVSDVAEIDPKQIRSVGFMISDKQVGPFRLEVKALSKQ